VIQRLAKAAGIEGRIGLHKFRKTFATMVAKEEGIEAARVLLGHEDVATTHAISRRMRFARSKIVKSSRTVRESFGN